MLKTFETMSLVTKVSSALVLGFFVSSYVRVLTTILFSKSIDEENVRENRGSYLYMIAIGMAVMVSWI